MQVDNDDPRPPYAQVADGLRRAIETGELPAGTKLPSGRELAQQWGVALMTLQKAVDQLRSEGLVYSQQGRGVFVAATDKPRQLNVLALQEIVDDLSRRLEAVEQRLGIEGSRPD
ncbi:GntR family transcriptional regulator [Kribbella sindirgiensis]|uniref:GntR family transcriptional regulator n=1 Tax=Kribbella sindirgiensis TaxID=1124744 RepID=A0A4R0INA2_9ACTN|nr:GntR family transcriptional regulator [Kribbella sindirgiensis]TCC35103.1 GntR family transcriptional regulator [Kribbella sindirgiensis]